MPDYRNMQTVSVTMPAPTLDADGRPTQPWTPTVTRSVWGRPQVIVGGGDYSAFRDAPTIVESFANAEPFGDTAARIRFPAITPFEAYGSGALSWLTEWAQVYIRRLHDDGMTTTNLFSGLIAGFEESDAGLVAVCMGSLHQASLYVRAPIPSDNPVDIREAIALQFDSSSGVRPHLRTAAMATTPATGILTRYRGAWETSSLDYVQKILELSATNAGDQWTVRQDYPSAPLQPVLALKDRTTVNWTVTVGTPGVDVSGLQRELSSAYNVVYGEGEYAGSQHRNFHTLPSGAPGFQPYSYDSAVHGLDSDGVGGLVDNSARVNTSLVRVEAFEQFGSGVTYSEALTSAEAQRLRAQDPGWVGTIRLAVDPQEGHRVQIRAGHNISVKSHRGVDRLFHVAAVEVDWGEGQPTVTLTVDTKARDLPTVAAIIKRNGDVSRKPLARLTGDTLQGAPTSAATWDENTGSGWVPTARKFDGTSVVALAAGWNIVKFRASERDWVWRVEAHTVSPATKFALCLAASDTMNNGTTLLSNLPSDPFAQGAWELAVTNIDPYIIHWGQYDDEVGGEQGAGYYPDFERWYDSSGVLQTGTLTGNFVSDGPFLFSHDTVDEDIRQPQFLWAAVFVRTACSFWARLVRGA